MSRSDMMPLWTDAYLADTQDLDAIQHGMYFLLIMRAWRSGEARLKDDERSLANIARVSLAQWRKHSPAIMAYWTLIDGYWTQKRLSELWSNREEFIKTQSKRGKNSEQSEKISQKRIAEKPNENNDCIATKAVAEADNINQPHYPRANDVVRLKPSDRQRIVDAWNAIAGPNNLKPVTTDIGNSRNRKIAKAIAAVDGNVDLVVEAISKVPLNPHWIGKSKNIFYARFDWMLEPERLQAAIELTPFPAPNTETQNAKCYNPTEKQKQFNGHRRREIRSRVLEEFKNGGVASQV